MSSTMGLKFTDCIECGVHFALPAVLYEKFRKEGGYYYCPSGHGQGWPKKDSEDERVRRERDQLKQQLARVEDEKREAIARAEREKWEAIEAENKKRRAAERKLKRVTRRHNAGVCDHCNRTFSQLQRHMASKHPEIKCEPLKARASLMGNGDGSSAA